MQDDKLEQRLARLDEKLGALPKEIEPANDLWPAIEARIGTAGGFGWQTFALAASVCLAVIVGATLWLGSPRSDETGSVPIAETTPAAAVSPEFIPAELEPPRVQAVAYPIERARVELASYPGDRYRETRDRELETLQGRIAALAPAERAAVERNLATIQAALEEIDAALAGDPDNALLKKLLLATYRQELNTMTTVNRCTGSMRTDL